MAKVWQVQVAAQSREAATALVKGAIAAKLAAGGQVVGPIFSAYWHLGEFETGEEWQAVFKTTDVRYPDLEQYVVERHDWANPEITAIPLAAGLASYLQWVEHVTAD